MEVYLKDVLMSMEYNVNSKCRYLATKSFQMMYTRQFLVSTFDIIQYSSIPPAILILRLFTTLLENEYLPVCSVYHNFLHIAMYSILFTYF